jgi:RNA polymerase nonessential primary-like sigma factor
MSVDTKKDNKKIKDTDLLADKNFDIERITAESSPIRAKNIPKQLDATQMYLSEIGFSPLLTADEEKEFGALARQGDQKARNRMIESNLRLVVKISRHYLYRGMSLLDLIEEGNLGLMHAVTKFDPSRGFRFSTYATWWIRQNIERALMNQTRTIRLPIHVVKDLNVYLRAARKLTQTLDHEPTPDDIAKWLDRPVKDVEKILKLDKKMTSADVPISVDEGGRTLLDVVADIRDSDPATLFQNNDLEKSLNRWIDELPDNECEVIERRFGLRGHHPETLEKVGEEIGVTRERVRQIQVGALKRLRSILEKEGLSKSILS